MNGTNDKSIEAARVAEPAKARPTISGARWGSVVRRPTLVTLNWAAVTPSATRR